MHPAASPLEELYRDCEVTRTRRSGPGGQHRNKTETAIVLRHKPTGLLAEAAERRSQEENRQMALWRLRIKLALEYRTPLVAAQESPSPLWRSRLQGARLVISPQHEDFPALLAEALDVLAALDFEIQAAATQLQCSSSQLVKLLSAEPAALQQVNARRAERGEHPLK